MDLTQRVDVMWDLGESDLGLPVSGHQSPLILGLSSFISPGHSTVTPPRLLCPLSNWAALFHLGDVVKSTKAAHVSSMPQGKNKTSGSTLHGTGHTLGQWV